MSRWPTVGGAYSDHVAALIGRIAAADARAAVAPADTRARHASEAAGLRARASVRLDASPLEDATADEVDARLARGAPAVALGGETAPEKPSAQPSAGGWATALRLDGMATQEVAALEYAGALAAQRLVADAGERMLAEPRAVLEEAHAALCGGLVHPDLLGRPRRTDQAVHDGATGRVLFRAENPDRLESLLNDLARWLAGPSAVQPAAVVAATVHERLLQWQPFEAANGRLARLAARGVLAARGLDREGLAAPEAEHAADPTGYWGEVAATRLRRGDLSHWLERDLETLALALEDAAAALGTPPTWPPPPPRATAITRALRPGATLTLKEYAERAGLGLALARREIDALQEARTLRPVVGGRGLVWRRADAPVTTG